MSVETGNKYEPNIPDAVFHPDVISQASHMILLSLPSGAAVWYLLMKSSTSDCATGEQASWLDWCSEMIILIQTEVNKKTNQSHIAKKRKQIVHTIYTSFINCCISWIIHTKPTICIASSIGYAASHSWACFLKPVILEVRSATTAKDKLNSEYHSFVIGEM